MLKRRVTDPSGVWEIDSIIGAKALITSIQPILFGNRLNSALGPYTKRIGSVFADSDEEFTISSVRLRISIDGKAITVVELAELPDQVFTLKDILILNLDMSEKVYLGTINATRSSFEGLTLKSLLDNAKCYNKTDNFEKTLVVDKSVFYIIIPKSVEFDSLTYVSQGFDTTETSLSSFTLTHDNLLIDNRTYKVYGYRNGTISENNILDYTIKLK